MNASDPLRVIIADPSQNAAEELASELRNAGFATRNQHVDDAADLETALGRQRWDLLVIRRDAEMDYDPAALIALARREATDFPILLLEDGTEIERLKSGLEAGATDVLLDGEDERFLLVLRRELANLRERRGRKHAEATMLESEKRNQLLLDSSRAAIAYVHEGMHVYTNRAYVDLFGYETPEDLEATPLLDLIDDADEEAFKARLKAFDPEQDSEPFEIRGLSAAGASIDGIMTLSAAAFDGEPCMQVLIRPPEDAGGASSEEMQRLRAQDPVTGLLNRPFFIEALSYVLEGIGEDGADERALAIIALDDADRMRAEIGIAANDEVLVEVAGCLRETLGAETQLARLSDDEFAAVLPAGEDPAALAERVRAAVSELLASASGKTVRVTASVGVARISSATSSVPEAVDQAHRAVGRIRERDAAGNAAYVFDPADFTPAQSTKSGGADDDRAREVLGLLTEAIKSNSLVLLFQPIVSLHGEGSEHYEVFLRLPDGDGNLMRPDEFMELAESAGLGGKVDRWVALNAIKRLTAHRAEGNDTRLTINLTHAALVDEAFLNWLKVALKAAKLPRDALIMQYSEEAATTYLKQAKAFGEAVGAMSCRLGLSHFGVGSNSFDTLGHLQADYVKLATSWVRDLESSPEKLEALKEVVARLEEHGKMAIVPMVSTPQVLASLFTSGANLVQGNYFCEAGPEMDYDFSGDM